MTRERSYQRQLVSRARSAARSVPHRARLKTHDRMVVLIRLARPYNGKDVSSYGLDVNEWDLTYVL
jgi:hypothetical protein